MRLQRFASLFLLSVSPFVYAATDPVSWRMSPSTGFPQTSVGNTSSVTITLTSHLPQPTPIKTIFEINGPGISIDDRCNKKTLALGKECQVILRNQPAQEGKTTIRFIYGYDNNRIPIELEAISTGLQPQYNLSGSIPNFPESIAPVGTYPFSAVFTNTGPNTLTNCYVGDENGANRFLLTPSSIATLSTTGENHCGTFDHPINLTTSGSGSSCTITGQLSSPYETGSFTLASTMHCAQGVSTPTVASRVTAPTIGLTGSITQPDPFPAIFYDDEAPYITAKFTNTGNTELTNCFATGTGFTINPGSAASVIASTQQSTCGSSENKVSINPTESCYLYGQLTHLVAPNDHVTLTGAITCTEASASPEKTFSIQHSSGSCTSLSITPILPLPTSTYVYADNVVKFRVTNECVSESIVLGQVNLSTTTGSATLTTNGTYDQCSFNTIAAGNHCDVTASVIPSSTTPLTVKASVTPTSPTGGSEVSATTAAGTVNTNQQPTHHFYFVNQCDFDVWYGIGNAAGTSGNATPDPNLTTYPTGAPASAYHLPAQVPNQAPSTIDLSFSEYINGALWPRTGCTMNGNQFVCATGTCATLSNSATCVSGTETLAMPLPPYTKIEQTVMPTAGADGVYDVSIINGMNVPVEMKAFGPRGANQVGTSTPGNPNNVYTCTGAGAVIQPTTSSLLAGCPWSFDPSSSLTGITDVNSDFYWVTPGSDDACSTSTLPQLCGMAYDVNPPANPSKINRKLGGFLAFSTLTNYIGYHETSQWGSQNLYTTYGMGTPITSTSTVAYGPPYNYTVMIGCIYNQALGSANSCNLSTLTNAEYQACCGCVDWTMTTPNTKCGGGSTNWPGTGTNSLWTTNTPSEATVNYTIEKAVTWLKNACPTTYVYQFDDTASSFQCNTDGATSLYTSYQITFCPGGISGLPTGASDARGTPPA